MHTIVAALMGLLAAGSLVTAVAAQTPPAHPLTPRTLTLGAVDDDIRKHMERLTPLARYLERELADEGIASVQIAVLPDSQSMAEAMRQGNVDLYFDSPLVATRIARMAGAIPILRRWKNGEATYSSVIVVPTNSAIASLEDLRGRVVGFQEPDSTSGYMLPVAMLQQASLPLRHLHRESERPQEDTVGYLFTGDDRNTVLWLVRGTIDAGATDTQGLRWLHDAQPGRFRVLARSMEVPRNIVVRTAAMDDALSAAIADTLRAMDESGEGLEVLDAFNRTTCFDDFPAGIEATFAPIHAVLDRLDPLDLI